ncbi:type IVB secretion system protein IcmH/DotU [Isoalcanivorax indicus]|uniref:type IVB secretion system protein IcmH/DotU n=1 Tax=Isoalcanivorax indicus TaxID=2202653 RepID=UPI000DB964B3|nr:type IVB secretion system protein IcmH/DotU [Isoalcanivorax indicus]
MNPLLECSAHLLDLVMPLRAGGGDAPDDLRERVLDGFDQFERMAFERQISTADVQQAKFALATFIDESVMASSWAHRMEWMSNPLQLQLFGEHLGGEAFFVRLAELRQRGEQSLDLLELYYVCLQLGFEGVYKLRGLEQLMALQVDLRSQIDGHRGVADPRLAPSGQPREHLFARMGREVPYWVIATVTVAFMFFSYTGYTAVSAKSARDAAREIRVETDRLGIHLGREDESGKGMHG